MSFKISWKTHFICFVISIVIIAAVYKSLKALIIYTLLYGFPKLPATPLFFLLISYIVLISIITTLIHELIHGVVYTLFGGKVKYGIKLVYAYTMETSGLPLSRTQFLIVLLSPLLIISVLSIVAGYQIGTMAFIFNFAGSSGDMLMALYLLRIKKGHLIVDRRYGFDIVQRASEGNNISISKNP